MSWDPAVYLAFENERLRPALDLIARIPLAAPASVADLGCGTGNVTRLLGERWPQARITGVDASAAMLDAARAAAAADPRLSWEEAELSAWQPRIAPDVVFSNAALHWLDDHRTLFPRLLDNVAPGGALAVQMPDNFGAPSHTALFAVARAPRWRAQLAGLVRESPVAPAQDYVRWLAAAKTLDAWTTEYLHLLPPRADGEHPVVAWTRGAALTPFEAALDAAAWPAFLAAYRARVAAAYPPLADGRVPFAFRRRFVVATR